MSDFEKLFLSNLSYLEKWIKELIKNDSWLRRYVNSFTSPVKYSVKFVLAKRKLLKNLSDLVNTYNEVMNWNSPQTVKDQFQNEFKRRTEKIVKLWEKLSKK